MKVNSQIKSLKLNLSLKVLSYESIPNMKIINDQWNECLISIKEIIEKGTANICYQELYEKINDLLLFEIPNEINIKIYKLFSEQAKNLTDELNLK